MKYLVLLAGYGDSPAWAELSEAEQERDMQRFHAFSEACRQRDGVEILAGEALGEGDVATTLRTPRGGEMIVTDGPFAEAAEQIGGFYLIEVPDLDVLIELCRELPPYVIDLRPVVDMSE